jgi:hypothetical protein
MRQVTSATVLPVLVSPDDPAYDDRHVLDEYFDIHGQPPALMLSFAGMESSVLLADAFWVSGMSTRAGRR